KTELAKALAESMFNDENMMTRIDMSEYQEKYSVSRLVGAPPGYVGYDEGGQLTEAIRRKPYSVVLLDEIEKADPDVFNILLQVLDDGRLTDNKGRTVDFKNTILIMTSNLQSKEELFKFMRPEFINRIDEIVKFKSLTKEDIREILKLQLKLLDAKLLESDIKLNYSDAFLDHITEKGFNPEFGARPVKRVLQTDLINRLAESLIAGKISKGNVISVDYRDEEVVFSE
ncbi:MAG: AAA family ATPase, partial [Bacteroidales bacterium]